MRIVSQDSFITVAFDTPLDPQGTSDVASYVVSNPGGGVPIAVQAVEVFEHIVTMDGSASVSLAPEESSTVTFRKAGLSTPKELAPRRAPSLRTGRTGRTGRRSALRALRPKAFATADADPPRSVTGVRLYTSKPTNGREYQLEIRSLQDVEGAPYRAIAVFAAQATLPSLISVTQLDEGQLVVTFSAPMRVDAALLSPTEYFITGPTKVLIKSVHTVADTQVMLTTVGMGSGEYTLSVNASGTPHDTAGNPISPIANQAVFSGSPALASRSVFTHKGPITKPALTLQSGTDAVVESQNKVTLPGANILSRHVGLYLTLSGTTENDGTYRITSRVSSNVVKVAASLHVPDNAAAIAWALLDYRDGQIADDPADVVVRINNAPVTPEAVLGLLGQVVLPVVPGPTDDVKIDYAWINNPVVDFKRLNSQEFRLNNWNRDSTRSVGPSAHKYRYNNTLIFAADLEMPDRVKFADVAQPQQRDLKYRAYERAYSTALNDPNLLVLNSPNHQIAFPPLSRPLKSTFVNYQSTNLPEASVDPWLRLGAGAASVVGSALIVEDRSDPIFWTRSLDLTFKHVFAHAWRMRISATPVLQGVFTGVAAGYSDGEKACVVGFLSVGGVKKFGILRRGFGNDPSPEDAWIDGELDWSILRSYRIFRDRSGTIEVYVDGAVVASLRVLADDLPFLAELDAPFNTLQGPFFGSLSKEAESTSTWSFVRYTAIPINPLESEPSIFVSYEGATPPEFATQPWTPVGFHGTETIVTGSHLLLDSTSATDLPSATAAGLISGDFKGYTRIAPLIQESFDTVLDVQLAVRTYTHGIAPNAVMAAIDDGNRLIQLSLFSDQATPKLSYGGRTLPTEFAPYSWRRDGEQTAMMVGQYLKIVDSSTTDALVYLVEDAFQIGDVKRVLGHDADYILEFRVQVLSYTPDMNGFCGVTSSARDGGRSVGVQFVEALNHRFVELHSDGSPIAGGRFSFEWFDGTFHTIRLTKSTAGDLVSVFADGSFVGALAYSAFSPPLTPALTGEGSFGSATTLSKQAKSEVLWAYSNYWRVTNGRKFVGLWKGYDSDSLTGYHLPITASGRSATVNGNVLTDLLQNFSTCGVASGDQLVIDDGLNKGVYTVGVVAPEGVVTKLTVTSSFPIQPSRVDYRGVRQVDWSAEHRYRIVKDSSGGVSVFLDTDDQPLIHADYSNTSLPPSSAGIPRAICAGLPSVTWGAFDPTNLSQTSWDFVRFGAIRSLSANGLVPPHQVLNQRNVMASFEHHRSNVPHSHTDFWSESEGIPPQAEPDLLRDPNVVAFTLLNDRTPLVPSTQTYEVRTPRPVLVPVAGMNSPQDILNHQGFLLNSAEQRVEILVPDDILYNSLQVIERSTGEADLIAPFDDEPQMSLNALSFSKEVCLSYDGSVLPENDSSAWPAWTKASDDPAHQTVSADSGVLTYGTDLVGTRTMYRNATLLPDATSLHTEVKFRLRLLQDASEGLGDSQVRVGFSSPGVTVGLAFVTTPIGERYVLAVDLNNGQTVGGIPFDFYDGQYHTYVLSRDPGSASIQIRIEP